MIRPFPLIACIFLFGSCTGLKQLGTALNRQPDGAAATTATTQQNRPFSNSNTEVKFLDNISGSSQSSIVPVSSNQTSLKSVTIANSKKNEEISNLSGPTDNVEVITPTSLQSKYSRLLGTKPNEIYDLKLYEFIDEWYGTRYKLGGTTKNGIDCSALVQSLFFAVYGIPVPRTSKEQYEKSRQISSTELQEGDLLFFHTRGRGVSHVGVYLQNNKFVHASISGGVMISDIYDSYFAKRLVGAGRVEK